MSLCAPPPAHRVSFEQNTLHSFKLKSIHGYLQLNTLFLDHGQECTAEGGGSKCQ